jgi:hypothetical protein
MEETNTLSAKQKKLFESDANYLKSLEGSGMLTKDRILKYLEIAWESGFHTGRTRSTRDFEKTMPNMR